MSFFDQIGGLLNQYVSGAGATDRAQAHEHYDQIYNAVPQDLLASVIGPALASLGGEQVQQRVYNSATEMSPQQRGSFLQTLLSGFSNSGIGIPALLGQLGINQQVANNPAQATPEEVARLAAHAHENNPGVFEQAMAFYAEHPQLVKILGTLAVSAIAAKLANHPQSNQGNSA